MTDKVVVYACSRNWYQHLPLALNSLFTHNPTYKAYIFCEDDTIECIHDSRVTLFNVNNYNEFIDPNGPQGKYPLGMMTFVRCWLSDVLVEDKILWLDVDTIVLDSLDPLFEYDMTGYIVAGAVDRVGCMPEVAPSPYINAGVMLMDLAQWRELNYSKTSKELLNTQVWKFGDQDIVNHLCSGYILYLDSCWNFGGVTKPTNMPPKILHFATAPKLWDHPLIQLWQKYYRKEI